MKEMWNEKYSGEEYAYGREANSFLQESAHHIPAKGKVLCLAEGEGRNAVYLAQQGHSVFAVDISEVGQAKALKLAEERKVKIDYQIGDVAALKLGHSTVDAVISIFAHSHKDVRAKTHAAIVDALKPSGVLILEAYSPEQLKLGTGGPKSVDLLFALEDVRAELNGLEILHAKQFERELIEGTLHTGTGAVTQIIAKRITK